MKAISKKFTVELTTEEVEMIHRALNASYKERKAVNDLSPDEKLSDTVGKVRKLRNEFSALVNTSYMGEDA